MKQTYAVDHGDKRWQKKIAMARKFVACRKGDTGETYIRRWRRWWQMKKANALDHGGKPKTEQICRCIKYVLPASTYGDTGEIYILGWQQNLLWQKQTADALKVVTSILKGWYWWNIQGGITAMMQLKLVLILYNYVCVRLVFFNTNI